MKTQDIIKRKVVTGEHLGDAYEKEVNYYLVVLNEKEYKKAKRIFKEN